MIRHIDNKPVFTNEAIAEALGFDPEKEPVKLLFDLKKRLPLPIHHEPGQKQVFMYQDAICQLRFQILRDKQNMADHLGVSLRTLGTLLQQPDFPVYRISKEEAGHAFFFVLKDAIAVWYKDYRFSAFMQSGNVKHLNRAKNDLAKIPCGTCGKPKFLIPGLTVSEVPPDEYFICSNLEDSYTLQIRDKNPVCPVCKGHVHPFTCFHPSLRV